MVRGKAEPTRETAEFRFAIRQIETIMHQVKTFTRNAKAIKCAATAGEALRLFREMQAGSGVTSCAISRKVCSLAKRTSNGRPAASRTCAREVSKRPSVPMHNAHSEPG